MIMENYGFLKNLDLKKEIIKIIENDIFLESYSIGEEIFNPETPINKVSIILSGSVRQIRKDTKINTNLYKYVKNDLLFFSEVIYSLENYFYYIAANDLQLISIEKDKFLKLLNENHEFRNWIDNQISKNEKISILQKLFEEEFNNNTDKEKLLNQLSENIRIIDEPIFKDIQAKKIELRDAQIYSISKSSQFDFLEKISFEKISGMDFKELNKLVIIDNKFKKFKIKKNQISKIEINNTPEKDFSDQSNKELNFEDIKIKRNILSKKENVLECFRILSKLIDINFRVDPISNYLDFLDKNKKKYAFINYYLN